MKRTPFVMTPLSGPEADFIKVNCGAQTVTFECLYKKRPRLSLGSFESDQ